MDGLGGSVEDRSVYGVENSSMFLECSPKSQRALIYWQLQKPNDDRRHEVCMFEPSHHDSDYCSN